MKHHILSIMMWDSISRRLHLNWISERLMRQFYSYIFFMPNGNINHVKFLHSPSTPKKKGFQNKREITLLSTFVASWFFKFTVVCLSLPRFFSMWLSSPGFPKVCCSGCAALKACDGLEFCIGALIPVVGMTGWDPRRDCCGNPNPE